MDGISSRHRSARSSRCPKSVSQPAHAGCLHRSSGSFWVPPRVLSPPGRPRATRTRAAYQSPASRAPDTTEVYQASGQGFGEAQAKCFFVRLGRRAEVSQPRPAPRRRSSPTRSRSMLLYKGRRTREEGDMMRLLQTENRERCVQDSRCGVLSSLASSICARQIRSSSCAARFASGRGGTRSSASTSCAAN
jgi:hypothetical protein